MIPFLLIFFGLASTSSINEENKTQDDIIEMEINESNIDELKELKNISTDIVVNEFLENEESLYIFLTLVYTKYINALDNFKSEFNLESTDVFFAFKGGNILRLVYKQTLNELPNLVSKKLKSFYDAFFKRSDADFSIYLNPFLENYENLYEEIIRLSYRVQVEIKEELENNLMSYFDIFKYKPKYFKKKMENYLANLNNSHTVKDSFNRYYMTEFEDINIDEYYANMKRVYDPRSDFILEKENDKNVMSNLQKNKSILYTSINKTLRFEKDDKIIRFALVRTKVNFNVVSNRNLKNLGGELIDVSITHREDNSLYHIFENLQNAISTYQIKDLRFYSYSLQYLIEDLENILFKSVEFPWNDNKYSKRLNRLFLLYLTQMFIKIKNNGSRKLILDDIILNLGSTNEDNYEELDHLYRMQYFYKLIKEKMNNLNELDGTFSNEYEEFKQIVKNNLNNFTNGFEDVDTYCSIGPHVNKNDIKKVDT